MLAMLRGEVYWINFDPSIGSEIKKIRPAVIISNNAANKAAPRIQVVPISSKIEKVYPFEVEFKLKGVSSKAMADQITTVDKSRVDGFMEVLPSKVIEQIEEAIKSQLGLRK
jgi:mRNA interferase MazF